MLKTKLITGELKRFALRRLLKVLFKSESTFLYNLMLIKTKLITTKPKDFQSVASAIFKNVI
jgi:hypothetical protein